VSVCGAVWCGVVGGADGMNEAMVLMVFPAILPRHVAVNIIIDST